MKFRDAEREVFLAHLRPPWRERTTGRWRSSHPRTMASLTVNVYLLGLPVRVSGGQAEAGKQAKAGKQAQQGVAGKQTQQGVAGKQEEAGKQIVAGKQAQQGVAGKQEQQGVAGTAGSSR